MKAMNLHTLIVFGVDFIHLLLLKKNNNNKCKVNWYKNVLILNIRYLPNCNTE